MATTTTSSSCNKRGHHQQADELMELDLLTCCGFQSDFDRVRELVEIEQVNVNCVGKYDGGTPLIYAARYNRELVARLLLENRADVHTADKTGWTAVCYAVINNNIAVAELLLEHGANTDVQFRFESAVDSLLAWAIYKQKVNMVALLLRFGANTEEIMYRGKVFSAVGVACWRGNVEIVQLLLLDQDDDGVDDANAIAPRTSYRPAMTPLCYACQGNNLEIAQLLLIHLRAQVIFDRGVYPDGPSPLVQAVKMGSLELVQLLLDHSRFSDTDIVGGMLHPLSPALEIALRRHKFDVAQLLVDSGANVNDRPFLCKCASHIFQQRVQAARLLLRAGANVNMADSQSDGETPLCAAAKNGHVELVKEFLKARADIRIRDVNGETPLGLAYRNGHNKDIVYLLLRTSPHVYPRLANATCFVQTKRNTIKKVEEKAQKAKRKKRKKKGKKKRKNWHT